MSLDCEALDRVDDPRRLQQINDGVDAERIEALARKWLARLPQPFTDADRAAGYNYERSILQAEFARAQVFDRPLSGRLLFEEIIREHLDLGRPQQVSLGRCSIKSTARSSQTYFKHGAVFARSLIPGEHGQPVYVEFDPVSGAERREIAEAHGDWAGLRLMAGDEYRAWRQRLADLQATQPELELVSAAAYRAGDYSTVEGLPMAKPDLAADTLFVALRPAAQRLLPTDALVLLELPIDPQQSIDAATRALLLDPADGAIRHRSANTIGFRVGFYGTEDDPAKQLYRGGDWQGGDWRRTHDDELYGPLRGVPLAVGPYAAGRTGEDGRYHLRYRLPPCPGFVFEYSTPVSVALSYKRFNPRGGDWHPYYLQRPGYDVCNGLGVYSAEAAAVVATSAAPARPFTDFAVDLMVLNGAAYLANTDGPVALAAATAFDHTQGPLHRIARQALDLDGDGLADTARLGREEDHDGETRFIPMDAADDPPLQGVWLSGVHGTRAPDDPAPDFPPDLTRRADWSADFQDRGLLSTLSADDLQDTDLYVFRAADGSLIAERKGLQADELVAEFAGVDTDTGRFRYTLHLLGDTLNRFSPGGDYSRARGDDFAAWQAAGGLDPRLHARDADHLRPGEAVRLIAINRASGYLGSLTTTLQAAGGGAVGEISFFIDELILRPPNLKLWAERQYEVEYGLTRGEDRDYLIGHEGAAASGDTLVTLYSEWLDPDGRPLPAALADYGYTARLAQVVAEHQLREVGVPEIGVGDTGADNGERLAHFPIRPGRQVHVIRLPERHLGEQHLYLQVNGQPHTRTADFAGGAGQGILSHRPSRYVPVQVPLFDETTTEQRTLVYHRQRQAFEAGELDTPPVAPAPAYRWVYRPEFQFSVFDLDLREVRRRDIDHQTQDVLTLQTPVLASTDQLVELLYDLNAPEFEPLTAYSYAGERELVLALGGQELRADVGANQRLVFDDLNQLGSVNPEDLLALRLYANNDSANVLYEWAFEFLAVDALQDIEDRIDPDTGVIELPADDPRLDLQAILVGYMDRAEDRKQPLHMTWVLEGDGAVSPVSQTDHNLGVFNTTLTLPSIAGSRAELSARLNIDGEVQEVAFGSVRVVPGAPATIQLTTSGELSVLGIGSLEAMARVRDAHGNPVADDTPIIFSVDGDASQREEDVVTTNGLARTVLTGGAFPSLASGLHVEAGGVTADTTFGVDPLQIEITPFTSAPIGSAIPVSAVVKDQHGRMVPGVEVELSSSYGLIREAGLTSDASGRVSATLVSPPNPGAATLTARVGFAGVMQQDYSVVVPSGRTHVLDARRALVVGDRAEAGYLTHHRDDGTDIGMDYPVAAGLDLRGAPGTRIDVQLGDLSDPNLAPVAAYFMSGFDQDAQGDAVAPDAVGLRHASIRHVELVREHPMGAGHSYRFRGEAYYNPDTETMEPAELQVQGLDVLSRGDDLGFRLDLKPQDGAATILDFNQGAWRLQRLADGRLQLSAVTESGSVSLHSAPLASDAWHRVGVRYGGGALSLEVNGERFDTPVSGPILFSGTPSLRVGGGYNGLLNSLRLYDWRYQPLLAFAEAGAATGVDLDASGRASVTVNSLGHLNAQQTDAALPMARVAVRAGTERQYVSLLSSAQYSLVGGFYVDHLHPDPPPLASAEGASGLVVAGTAVLDALVPPARAASLGDVGSWMWEGVNWIIPLEDFKLLGEHLYYLASSDPRFDAMELSLATVGALTVLPMAKPLKPVIRPLRNLLRSAKRTNPRFLRSFASRIGARVKRAWDTKSAQTLIDALPFLAIVGELMLDPDARDGLGVLLDSVKSDDDLTAWIDYLRLPADGWEGDELPAVSLHASPETAPWYRLAGARVLDGLVPAAHASWPFGRGPKRRAATARELKPLLKALGQLDDRLTGGGGAGIIAGIRGVTGALKATNWPALRKLAFNRTSLVTTMAVGRNGMRRLLHKGGNLRMSPLVLAAIITYLETRNGQCAAPEGVPCEELEVEVARKLQSFYRRIFTAALFDNTKRFGGARENGWAFHLAMLAVNHLSCELDDRSRCVLDVEARQRIRLYRRMPDGGVVLELGRPYDRKVDLLLQGDEDNGAGPGNHWVECKSYKGTEKNLTYFQPWKLGRGELIGANRRVHREFFLDRVALEAHDLTPELAANVEWQFQRFERRTVHGMRVADLDRVAPKLGALLQPADNDPVSLGSLGLRSKAKNNNPATKALVRHRLKEPFSIKRWVLHEAGQQILDGIDPELIDEVITHADHDIDALLD